MWRAVISYSDITHGYELTQVLNVIFGNTSIKEGIEVVEFVPSPLMLTKFRGPRFGVPGLRTLLGVAEGVPLLMTALKPMGTPTAQLADMAYKFARGGIDIIKDDHGLSNQPDSPFEARAWRGGRGTPPYGGGCTSLHLRAGGGTSLWGEGLWRAFPATRSSPCWGRAGRGAAPQRSVRRRPSPPDAPSHLTMRRAV